MDSEDKPFIKVSYLKGDIKPSFSFQKDIKNLKNIFILIVTFLSIFLILIFFLIVFALKSKSLLAQYFEKKKIIKDLNYYIKLQDYFCDYIHLIYDKKIEDELILYKVSLERFIASDLDILEALPQCITIVSQFINSAACILLLI